MPAKYILSALAVFFLGIGAVRLLRDGGRALRQSRSWLLVGAMFGAVSAWLWLQS